MRKVEWSSFDVASDYCAQFQIVCVKLANDVTIKNINHIIYIKQK